LCAVRKHVDAIANVSALHESAVRESSIGRESWQSVAGGHGVGTLAFRGGTVATVEPRHKSDAALIRLLAHRARRIRTGVEARDDRATGSGWFPIAPGGHVAAETTATRAQSLRPTAGSRHRMVPRSAATGHGDHERDETTNACVWQRPAPLGSERLPRRWPFRCRRDHAVPVGLAVSA
jgi:hypothetical protein